MLIPWVVRPLVLALALLFVTCPFASALNPTVKLHQYSIAAWRKQDGLPASRVLDVLQTRDGYLWAGTSDGLARFDGKRFTRYNLQKLTGATSNGIRCLLEDHQGRLWIGTSNGLANLESGVFKGAKNFTGIAITGLVEDREGTIWIGTTTGLHRWRPTADRAYTVADGLPSNNVFSGALATNGSLWFATDRGPVRFLNESFTTFTTANGLADNIVTSVHADRRGNIWVGTTQGLSRFQNGSFFTYSAKTVQPAISVMALLEDRNSNIWLGGTNSFGPVRMQSGHFDAFPAGSTASDPIVYAYTEDREGALWMATSDGLQQIRDRPFTNLTTADGLPANNIRIVYPTKDGTIWLGANRSGLTSLKDNQIETFDPKDGLSARGISALLERQNGAFIAATTYHGLNLLQGKHWIPFLNKTLPTKRITGLLEDRQGDLWIGTEDQGAFHVHGGQAELISQQQGLTSNFISKLLNGPNGQIWIGTDHGLRIWDNGILRSLNAQPEFETANISGLLAAVNGAMWITTPNGLYRFFNGGTVHFNKKQGIPDGPAAQPVEDNQGKLWFFSSAGLLRFTPPPPNSDQPLPAPVDLFTAQDGLASDSHGGPPQHIAKSPDGHIWIATARGLSTVDPAQIHKNPFPPPVRIEEIVADGQALKLGSTISLNHRTQRVEIRYTGLSLAIPERVQFKYRLEGFDEKWTEAGTERSAMYTNLPPANYLFRVLACNNDGVWNNTGASIAIIQLPHFYQTWWFRILETALGCLTVWSLYQLRLKQIGRDFALVLEERTRIARELHDTLLQGFTAATLQVQAATDRIAMPPAEREALESAMLKADEQLREARRAVWDLRPSALESRDLVSALQKLANTAPNVKPVRSLIVEGEPTPLNARVESALLRVAEEAVANANRHSKAEAVIIRLTFSPDRIHLAIKDNGKGFHFSPTHSTDGHFGLRGMRERVETAGGHFSLTSSPGQGTEITAEFRTMRNFI